MVRTSSTEEAKRHFQILREQAAVLDRFETPAHLVSYLNDPEGDLDLKDRIYGVLVRAAQSPEALRELAFALVWLGLGPGLDRLYDGHLRYFSGDPASLVSEISVRFTLAVQAADLGAINRVAATLILNTRRRLMASLKRRWSEEARTTELPPDGLLADTDEVADEGEVAGVSEPLQLTRHATVGADLEELRRQLSAIAGKDADLLVAVLLDEESQKDAANRLGISHESVRKRFQRALKKVREELSHSSPSDRVYPMRASGPSRRSR